MKYPAVLAAVLAMFVLAAALPSAADAEDGSGSATFIEGYVSGNINGENVFLGGAEITATGENGTIYRTDTDSKGFFSLPCPQGNYSISVERNGFRDVDFGNVTSGGPPLYVAMEPRSAALIWGLDTPHAMELLGVAIFFAILGAGIILYRVCKKKGPDGAPDGGEDAGSGDAEEDPDGISYGDEIEDDWLGDDIRES